MGEGYKLEGFLPEKGERPREAKTHKSPPVAVHFGNLCYLLNVGEEEFVVRNFAKFPVGPGPIWAGWRPVWDMRNSDLLEFIDSPPPIRLPHVGNSDGN